MAREKRGLTNLKRRLFAVVVRKSGGSPLRHTAFFRRAEIRPAGERRSSGTAFVGFRNSNVPRGGIVRRFEIYFGRRTFFCPALPFCLF